MQNLAEFDNRVDTLDDLKRSIAKAYPRQKIVGRYSVSGAEEPYVEIAYFGLARSTDDDIRKVKKFVVRKAAEAFAHYAEGKAGIGVTLYWRVEPEESVQPKMIVERWADDGPDVDVETHRRCYGDHNWSVCGVYMRLLISDSPRETRRT